MDNASLDEKRRAWLEDADEGAITALIEYAMEASYIEARRLLRHDDARDVSINTAQYVWSVLEDIEDFEVVINRATHMFTKRMQRAEVKQNAVEEEIKERRMGTSRRATEERRGQFRDLIVDALTTREWQVIHATYWGQQTQATIAKRIGVTQQRVNSLKRNAIDHLSQALGRIGLTKDNWRKWYYAE